MRKSSASLLRRCVGLGLGVAVVASITAVGAQQADGPATPPGRRFALLVGVTEFIAPAMKKYNLQGPANDVALFRTLLTSDRFRVPDDAIVALDGLPADEAARPTRANIERAFRRLRDQAGPGDQVIVLLAGHGSQQPANPDPTDDEPDGLDEIFLPADTLGWDSSSHAVANAIVDDDIRQWVGAIRNKGAMVTIIVDACHSGTITRAGASPWRERGIPVEALVPAAALAVVRSSLASTSPGRRASSRALDFSDAPGDIAALYAADVAETTPELPMPDRNGPTQGLFTYTLTRILTEHTGPISYRELVQRVTDRYRAEGFTPAPSLEGAGVDREVLGDRTTHERPTFAIDTRRSASRWMVAGGSIHGLTRGSILELLPVVSRRGAPPVGYVRVLEVRPTTALVTPIAFARMPAPRVAQVVPGSRVHVRHFEFGALRLRVALQQAGAEDALAVVPAGSGPRQIERALKLLPEGTDGLVQRVNTADADWFVRVDGNRVVLARSAERDTSARRAGRAPQAAKRFDVGAVDDPHLADALADQLRRIARAVNLSRLSSYVDREADVQVGVLRYAAGATTPAPLPAADGDPGVRAGERLQFVVRNTGKVPLDITVLYVDANFGIWPLFPATDSALDNRLVPGEQRALDPVEITADPVGWESVVAIGVEATLRHENFLMLAQDSLADARGSSNRPTSPVRMLLESAVYGTRAAAPDAAEDRGRFAITQTWFRVEER